MTERHPDADSAATRPISVAELLARNGTIGSPPVTGRRRRRRGGSDEVTVAELTGEIPVIRDDAHPPEPPATHAHRPNGSARGTVAGAGLLERGEPGAEPSVVERIEPMNWAEAGPRWPASPPQPSRGQGPERSPYPRPARKIETPETPAAAQPSSAEQMSPDPAEGYAQVDVIDTEVRDPEPLVEDPAVTGSLLRPRKLFSKARRQSDAGPDSLLVEVPDRETADLLAESVPELDDDHAEIEADLAGADSAAAEQVPLRIGLLRGLLTVLQSVLAVVFGAGLFVAFETLWRWNNIVALVLSVLVILGLVVAVRVVRKTEDIASTLIAVAVGALITLGPLALLQSSS